MDPWRLSIGIGHLHAQSIVNGYKKSRELTSKFVLQHYIFIEPFAGPGGFNKDFNEFLITLS